MVPALDILIYGHCKNVCYLLFRRKTSSVRAFVLMVVIYGSGVRYHQLGRLLKSVLSMVPVIYGSGVRHPQFRRLFKCLLSMVRALNIPSYGVC